MNPPPAVSLRPYVKATRKTTFAQCSQGCGRFTRAACGICEPCQRGEPVVMPAVERLTDAQLAAVVADAVAEVRRRQERLAAVLRDASAFGG